MVSKKAVLIPLLSGLMVQVFTAWNSFFFHSDEYFQIIEFASHRYNFTPANVLPWEFAEKIRPSLQIHFFALFYKFFSAFGITDRFVILSLLYVFTGLMFFAVSNYLLLDRFKNKTWLPRLLWINNFFWIVPYLRCRYSSETMGALFWIGGTILLAKLLEREKSKLNTSGLFVTGIVFSFSFYCRFQMMFAFIGLAAWFLIQHFSRWQKGFTVLAGFIAGVSFNLILDKLFYGQWVFTPYRYFYVNIIEGKANSFGTSPWWYYIVILMAVGIPLAGLTLFYFFAKGLSLYKNPFALATLFFIAGHSLTGHKEERFIFPVVLVMVYLAAEAYDTFPLLSQKSRIFWKHRFIGKMLRSGCYFAIVINVVLVVLFCAETYKQPVLFIKEFNKEVAETDTVISFRQHPYNTESGLRYAFLSQNKHDSRITVINDKQKFLQTLQQHPDFRYCILLSDAKNNNLGYLLKNNHAIVASSFIWNVAAWLALQHNIIIPDLWICQTYRNATNK